MKTNRTKEGAGARKRQRTNPSQKTRNSLSVQSRQETREINVSLLKRITKTLLQEFLPVENFELGVYLVDGAEISDLNATFIGHKGITDVIALDYCEGNGVAEIAGEIFVCVAEALVQAKRFGTTWQSEIIRYVVHGVLHLSGYDDRLLPDRRRMKDAEDRLVAELGRRFSFRPLRKKIRKPKVRARIHRA